MSFNHQKKKRKIEDLYKITEILRGFIDSIKNTVEREPTKLLHEQVENTYIDLVKLAKNIGIEMLDYSP